MSWGTLLTCPNARFPPAFPLPLSPHSGNTHSPRWPAWSASSQARGSNEWGEPVDLRKHSSGQVPPSGSPLIPAYLRAHADQRAQVVHNDTQLGARDEFLTLGTGAR